MDIWSGGFVKRRPSSEREGRGSLAGLELQEENNAPMMAIFGGMFALMLVFLLIVNVYSSAAVRERLDRKEDEGQYRIERMDGGAGYVVIVFPKVLRIIETGAQVQSGLICEAGSPFVDYAQHVYRNEKEQLVFFILEGGVPVMSEARNCLRGLWPGRLLTIGWVIADNEFLKSVALDDIPKYIREYVR